MGIAYRVMYALGFAPWDRDQEPDALRELVAEQAPGRALDLGCGMGAKSVYLARHGWQVVGVDAVPRALKRAGDRARTAGVSARFMRGDVTRLGDLGLETGFDLFFDFGCFHGLGDRGRDAYAEGVTRLAAPRASLLMMAFTANAPAIVSTVQAGELRHRFPAWRLEWERPVDPGTSTAAMRRSRASWFRLKRESPA